MNKCQTSKKKEITKYILATSFKSIVLTIPFLLDYPNKTISIIITITMIATL